MTAFYIVAGVIAILALLLFLPLSLQVKWDNDRHSVRWGIWPFRFLVRMSPDETDGSAAEKDRAKKTAKRNKAERPISDKIRDAALLAQSAASVLPKFFRAIHVPSFIFSLYVSGKDPAETALLYGSVCAGFGAFWKPFSDIFSVKDPKIIVEADFEGSETSFSGEASVASNLFRLLGVGIAFLIAYYKFRNKSKIQ